MMEQLVMPDVNLKWFEKLNIVFLQPMSGQTGFLPESLLWNFVIQLTSALRHIHSASLACRSLDPTKVLITGGPSPRLLLNCCGISDVLNYEATCSNPMAAIVHYQQEDLVQLGKIILGILKVFPLGFQTVEVV